MKLLVIEDDRETAAYLVKGLSESGYAVDQSGDGREGLFLATSGSYDAIILDRMLPGMDGLSLLGALRGAKIGTPALILSALGSVDDRVKGLRSGGDDDLRKPIAFSELLARIEPLLRRRAELPSLTRWRGTAGRPRLTPPALYQPRPRGETAGQHPRVSTGRPLFRGIRAVGAGGPGFCLLDQRRLCRTADRGDPQRRDHRARRTVRAT